MISEVPVSAMAGQLGLQYLVSPFTVTLKQNIYNKKCQIASQKLKLVKATTNSYPDITNPPQVIIKKKVRFSSHCLALQFPWLKQIMEKREYVVLKAKQLHSL